MTLNDLDHVTSKYLLLWPRVTPGTPLIFDCPPFKVLPYELCYKEKNNIKMRFSSNLRIWRRQTGVFCIYPKGGVEIGEYLGFR